MLQKYCICGRPKNTKHIGRKHFLRRAQRLLLTLAKVRTRKNLIVECLCCHSDEKAKYRKKKHVTRKSVYKEEKWFLTLKVL